MRFTEIADPEDQLALWKLVSDNIWSAFGQQAHQQPSSLQAHPHVKNIRKAVTSPLGKKKDAPVKANKPKKAPMAPAPKPLPKPKPQQLTHTQADRQQTQQYQQLAHHINQALTRKTPAQPNPQPTQPKAPVAASMAPMNNSYSERDKDELVFHRRENPLKPLRDQKPLI